MMSMIFVIASLLILYATTSNLTAEFSRLIHRFGGDRNALIVLWSVIFLPGTVIHEMSHFLFAIVTGARTGKIEIFPRFIDEDNDGSGVTLGSVQTQRLNPVQGFLIGTAPFFVGIAILVWLSVLIRESYNTSQLLPLLVQAYLFFTVSNSFFPSWTDIKQVIPLTVIAASFLLIAWLVGFEVAFSLNSQLISLANMISAVLLVSASLNVIISTILWLARQAKTPKH